MPAKNVLTVNILGDFSNCFTYIPQLPGKRGDGPKGWAIQAKLNIMIWLGLHKHKKDYLKDAPKGYQTVK